MAGVLTDEGLEEVLRILANIIGNGNLSLHLFVNNFTPTQSSVLADFTICTLPGYSSVSMNPGDYVISNISHVWRAEYGPHTFVFTGGGQTLYGFLVKNPAATKCLGAQLFATPYVPSAGGGSLELTVDLFDLLCPL